MSELFSFDVYAPREIAQRVETVGVTKARMAALPWLMLGVLAGAFIGLGAMFFVLVRSDATLGFATAQVRARAAASVPARRWPTSVVRPSTIS